MTHLPKKKRVILLISLGVLLMAIIVALAIVYTVTTLQYDRTMNSYLSPYGEAAVAYLQANEDFAEEFGEATLHVENYSYAFNTPGKYSRLSLAPRPPATAEEFTSELAYLTVSVHFSGLYTVHVTYEPTPSGYLEITGWENPDE